MRACRARGVVHGGCSIRRPQGFVPSPGTVGYGATVWDRVPTYPTRITGHGGVPTWRAYPLGIAERWHRKAEVSTCRLVGAGPPPPPPDSGDLVAGTWDFTRTRRWD